MKILEEKGVKKYLEKRGIIKQYRKVKKNFEEGNYQQILLKKGSLNNLVNSNFG
jgi:hypothetical protein